jgi:hypothetical protein
MKPLLSFAVAVLLGLSARAQESTETVTQDVLTSATLKNDAGGSTPRRL